MADEEKPDVRVMNTPRWSAEQAILAAGNAKGVEQAFICIVNANGQWDTIVGGKHNTGDLLMAAEVLKRRAFRSMNGW